VEFFDRRRLWIVHHLAMDGYGDAVNLFDRRRIRTVHHLAMDGYGERMEFDPLGSIRSLLFRPEDGGQRDGSQACCDEPILGHLFDVVLAVQLCFHEGWKSSIAEGGVLEVAIEIPGVSHRHAIDHLLTCLDLIGDREA